MAHADALGEFATQLEVLNLSNLIELFSIIIWAGGQKELLAKFHMSINFQEAFEELFVLFNFRSVQRK